MVSSNLQYQQVYPSFPSQYQQQYGQNFSYQGLLSGINFPIPPTPLAPAIPIAHIPPPKPSQKKKKKTSLNAEEVPEKVPAPVVRHWTVDEDITLVKARLHVSCDPDIGIGQKSGKMWGRILQVWRQNMEVYDTTRDSNALACRWARLQAEINKFHACYERVERLNKSGTTAEDTKRAAMRMYQNDPTSNQVFKHEECWELCRNNAKWCTKLLTKQNGTKKRKSVVDISNEESPPLEQTQLDPSSNTDAPEVSCSESKVERPNEDGVTRPTIGRKGVKDQKKRVVAEKSVADALCNLQSTIERRFGEEMELKRKALKRKEDERILGKDLSKLAPNVRLKFEVMQAKILKEWEEDGSFGDVSSNGEMY